jgi:bacterioferritin (cytochrome b1)
MLETDIQLEKATKKRYKEQIEGFKDYPELVTIIQSVLIDEEDHEKTLTTYLFKSVSLTSP